MKGKSKIQLALWALLFMVAIPISAYGVDGQIKIAQTAETTFPITINEPGSYVLTSNLMVSTANVKAIKINTDNVTLDLNGHSIFHGIGPGAGTGYGIYAQNKFNITIKNGLVRGFYNGIRLYNDDYHKGAGHRIEGIQASNNSSDGIYANYSTVTNCTANRNDGHGIYASYSTVTNCTANYNDGYGIYAPGSTVTNCTANENRDYGIYAPGSTVTNCTANENRDYGICVLHGTVTNCTANYNGEDGIYASESTVKGCNVRYNTGYGINMLFSNYIYRNAAGRNTAGQINCPSGNTCVDNATF